MVSEKSILVNVIEPFTGLNPCSCGGWSQRVVISGTLGLWDGTVLILVLVEDGLRDISIVPVRRCMYGLNPCSCGGWSQRLIFDVFNEKRPFVLILVLVEDGLRGD